MLRAFILILCLGLISESVQAQKGKDGTYTNSSNGEILNAYTNLTNDANAGATSLTVASNALNSGFFSSNLQPGDLLFIVQHQGATLEGAPFIIANGPGTADDDTISTYMSSGLGSIQNYNNCGNYEFVEVISVTGGNTINLRCGLEFSYTASGKVQVIRVPRFTDLTINNSVTAPAWNGTTGGMVVLEVENDLTLNGSIDVDGLGFRGGTVDNVSSTGPSQYAATDPNNGARKGEGVGGYNYDYNPYGGMYGQGAYGNAGGGATAHNAGGGGGANASTLAWDNGLGIPDPAYAAAWNLETGVAINYLISNMSAATNSGGGGRGGYSWGNINLNAIVDPPDNAAWGGDNRRIRGGLGGRPLNYAANKIFFGGGGGAGDMNDNQGGDGGSAGGIVFLRVYGNVAGTGSIDANGNDGQSSDSSSPPFGGSAGIDGAGGAGAGGTVFVESAGSISAISINANGGNGGDQFMVAGAFGNISEAYGPGGGGGGGYVSTTSAGPTVSIIAGVNGTTNGTTMTEFPPNGATSGAPGVSNNSLTAFGFTVEDDTICGGGSASLSITTYGTVPGGTTVIWYSDLAGTIVGVGNTFNTPVLAANTTYYVGMCPEGNLTEVNVVVSPAITIDQTSLVVADENCGNADGSITGLAASGGTGTLTFDWNGNASVDEDLSNVAAGSYTLTVTDQNNCTATAGPFTINNSGGPTIDASGVTLTDENCGNGMGSITGITASGGTAPLSYSWNGNSTLGPDTVNIGAGSYILTVTDGAGCATTSGPYTINNIGAPTIDVTGMVITDETCTGTNGSITGIVVTGATSPVFDWNGNVTATTDLTGVGAGNYTFTVTDGACTASVGPFTINDQPAPVIDISAMVISDENCGQVDGSITGITVTGTPTLSYAWNGNASATPDLTNVAAGAYTLVVTDGNTCTSTVGPFNIGSYTGPTIDITNMVITPESCFGNDGSITGITASGNGTMSYDWNGSASVTADTTMLTGGAFTLTVTDGVGCSATSGPHTITTNTGPIIDATNVSLNDENCGNADGSITGITVSGGTGQLSYDWNGTNTLGTDTVNIGAGTYTLTVMDAAGCSATSGPYTINGAPPVVVGQTGTTTICEGQSTTLTGTGATTYEWIPGGTGGTFNFSPTTTTTYSVVGTTGPCTDTLSFTITVNPLPATGITGDTVICEGESTTLTATGSFNFTWSDMSTNQTLTVSPGTTTGYQLVASNTCGNDTANVTVHVNPLPTADAGPDQTILLGSSATLDGSGGTSYAWTPPDGLSCTNCEDPLASPTQSTTYYVTVTDGNGCVSTDSVRIEVDESSVLFIPNVFSPNGDNLNDILYVRGGGIESFVFRVYDRWGALMFETSDLSVGWDGTYKGEPVVQGVYVYGMTGKYFDGKAIEEKGNITVVR